MVVFGQCVCIQANVVILGQNGCIREFSCIREQVVVLWQKCLFSGKSCYIRAKMVVFGQSGCILKKYVELVPKWL